MDKTAAARAQIHAKADAQRRRNGKRAAALEGKEQHGKHREDAPGAKPSAVSNEEKAISTPNRIKSGA